MTGPWPGVTIKGLHPHTRVHLGFTAPLAEEETFQNGNLWGTFQIQIITVSKETQSVWKAHRDGVGTTVNTKETINLWEIDRGGQTMVYASVGSHRILLISPRGRFVTKDMGEALREPGNSEAGHEDQDGYI